MLATFGKNFLEDTMTKIAFENNLYFEFYCNIIELLENTKQKAIEYGVDVKNIMEAYEMIKLGVEEEDPKEASERGGYEADKKALEDIVYYKRKCLDEYYIRERINNYEKKQKVKEQIKAEFKKIFDNVKELFG